MRFDFDGSEYDHLAARGFAAEQLKPMLERVTGIAESVGLHYDYDYDRLQHTTTVLAHQLIHYAKAHGKQHQMKERLLAAYFEEGRHVGRIGDLADLAVELGEGARGMSEAITVIPSPAKLELIGDPDAEACVGEFCELPAHREQAVLNRRVDSDLI